MPLTRRAFMAAIGAGATMIGASSPRATAQTPAPDVRALAITDVTVIDGTEAPAQPSMTVIVEDERIAEIVPGSSPPRAGVQRVDGGGRYLIPGLWDAHVHTFLAPWQPEHHLPLFIANGVTGIRDMGGAFPIDAIDNVRAAVASGERVGPRIVAGVIVDGPTPVWPIAMPVGTADEGRRVVATIADAGADFVKVYTLLPRDAFLAIAAAANKRAIPFAGHVPIAVTAAAVSDAGQRTVEHYSDSLLPYCSTAEDEVLAELRAAASGPEPVQAYAAAFFATLPQVLQTIDAEKTAALAATFATNQTWFTPTLIIGHNAAQAGSPDQTSDPRLRYLPPEVVSSWIPQVDAAVLRPAVAPVVARRSLEVGSAICRAMQQAAAPLLAGTDVGLPFLFPGFSLHDELALLVEAGLSPLQALQAATRNPAQAVGLGADLGTIEVGKLADRVLLDADPLVDIRHTTRIAAVVANGRLFTQPDLARLLRTAERPATPIATPAQ